LLLSQILRGVPTVSPRVRETVGTGGTPNAEEEAKPDDETKDLCASTRFGSRPGSDVAFRQAAARTTG